MNKHKKFTFIILIISAVIFYYLAGIWLNPFIFWTALPLYISFVLINKATKTDSTKRLFSAYGFLIVSIGFSLFYHFTWYFDWQGTKTGSSTSALIFVWLPIYSVVLGFAGYFAGSLIGKFYSKDFSHL